MPSTYRVSTNLLGVDCLRRWIALGSFGNKEGSFLKDPWLVLGEFYLDVSNLNMLVYEFRTSHINIIKNEQARLDKTY